MICLAINNTKALKAQRSMVIEGDIVAVLLAAVAAPIALLVVVVVDKWALQMPLARANSSSGFGSGLGCQVIDIQREERKHSQRSLN